MMPAGGGGTTGSTGGGGSSQPCLPALHVPWQIVADGTDTPITCATAFADSAELDVNDVSYAQACPPNDSGGEFAFVLNGSGTYTLDAFLVDPSGTTISEVHPPTITVGCTDFTTPTIVFPVIL